MTKKKYVLIGLLLLSVSACRPLSDYAPTLEMIQSQGPSVSSFDPHQVNRGRKIYVQDCSRCHSVLAVHDYTAAQWHEELPDMVEESALSKEEEADLRAYIKVALQYKPALQAPSK